MAVTKKTPRKSTRKKKRKTQQNNETIYLFAVISLILLAIGFLQFGVIGVGIDSLLTYIFGSAKYFAYILISLIIIYVTVNKKFIPLNRKLNGWLSLSVVLPFFLQMILRMSGHEKYQTFTNIFEIESKKGFFFHGGGMIGYIYSVVIGNLISPIGAFMMSIIMMILSVLLILGKSIRKTSEWCIHTLIMTSKYIFNKVGQKINDFQNGNNQSGKNEDRKHKTKSLKDVSELEEIQDDSDIPIFHSHNQIKDGEKQEFHENVSEEVVNDTMHSERAERQPTLFDQDENISNNKQTNQHSNHNDDEATNVQQADTSEYENLKYELPPITLLNEVSSNANVNTREVKKKGQLLESTLKNFGVNAKVSQIRIGPAVTQYEVQPAMGVKVSRIVNLHNDIALALAAKDIRIEAPIPGKSAVGIEVPNGSIAMVSLREVLEASPVEENKLKVALGRDISGEPISAELNKMPHLLVAGATGSGKSVCINGIITSILMNAKPHEVKLMMIDPKMVELNVYNGIPHLLTPVVTNPQKAAQALQKIVGEMERRYDLFSHTGTRNIEGYNQYLKRQNEEAGEKNAMLPYIVVIVDELADLMMVASKDVEAAIMRIAQMARAAGIHLIIATQRPSVDVITGLIKANIPSRIAFSVSSAVDSRTILDGQGAEKLLGKGDMLYLPYGQSKPVRVQGAFLSDAEVEAVVNFVTKQQSANYIQAMEPSEIPDSQSQTSEDDLYEDAKLFVIEKQKASASLLQRQFRIGYNRAARLIDELEANGVIGPATGSKPRQVLIDYES